MTVQEMVDEFGLRYTSEINVAVPGWEPDEIVSWLNNAQLDVVDNLHQTVGESALEELIVAFLPAQLTEVVPTTKPVLNTQYFEFPKVPTEWRFILSVHCDSTRSDVTAPTVNAKIEAIPTDINRSINLVQTMFNEPWFREIYYYLSTENYAVDGDYDQRIIILRDSFTTVVTVEMRFIRNPATLVITEPIPEEPDKTDTCELHVKYHDNVVDRAVTLAIEALMNPRLQTQPPTTRPL